MHFFSFWHLAWNAFIYDYRRASTWMHSRKKTMFRFFIRHRGFVWLLAKEKETVKCYFKKGKNFFTRTDWSKIIFLCSHKTTNYSRQRIRQFYKWINKNYHCQITLQKSTVSLNVKIQTYLAWLIKQSDLRVGPRIKGTDFKPRKFSNLKFAAMWDE